MKVLVFLCLLPAAFAGYLESVAASVAAGTTERFQGMVAFKCGRPSIHLSPSDGWIRDMTQDCVASSAEIKLYCQRMYPDVDIVNVEPTPYKLQIANWCDFNEKSCGEGQGETVEIHPYRCLAAGFQSDALLVPSNCTFHHLVPGVNGAATKPDAKERICKEYSEWKTTAVAECHRLSTGRRKLSSFSGLLGCRKDEQHQYGYFEGVEFVCCPPNQVSTPPEKAFISEPVVKEPETSKRDPYIDYLNRAEDNKETEHERYVSAKDSRKKGMTEDEDRLVKTFIEAERGLEKKWSIDPEVAASEEKTIIERFRAAFSALLDEEMAELRQLDSVHQQRVFMKLRTKKIRAKKMLEYAIQETDPTLERISAATTTYIRAIMKEKLHTINHYYHLLDSDPEQAKKQLPFVQTYLRELRKDMKKILGEMDKHTSNLSDEMKARIQKSMITYADVEKSANSLEENGKLAGSPILGESRRSIEMQHMESVIKAYRHQQPEKSVVHVEPVPEEEEDEEDLEHDVAIDKKVEKPEYVHHAVPQGPYHHAKAMVHSRHEGGHDHDGDGREDHSPGQHDARIVSGFNTWVIVGSVAGVALVAAITALLVLRRRYSGYTRSPHSDPAVVAIERSIAPSATDEAIGGDLAAMQANGYENPTYKYFELKGQDVDANTAKA